MKETTIVRVLAQNIDLILQGNCDNCYKLLIILYIEKNELSYHLQLEQKMSRAKTHQITMYEKQEKEKNKNRLMIDNGEYNHTHLLL